MMQQIQRERARQLKEKRPGYGPLLDFYLAVREAQQSSKPTICVTLASALERETVGLVDPARPQIEKEGFPIDKSASVRLFVVLCRLGKAANPHFATQTMRIEQSLSCGALNLEALLAAGDRDQATAQAAIEQGLDLPILSFLVTNSVRPSIELVRDQMLVGFQPKSWRKNYCPVCRAPPTLSLLKGDPVFRYSLCSHCGCHWLVDRLSCSVCSNGNPDSLQYFHGEGEAACRIDLCDSCHHYIKTIDVRGLEEPEPCLEDLATLHLDALAVQKGYSRVVPNLWCE